MVEMKQYVHHTSMQEGYQTEVDEEHITTLVVSETDYYAGHTEVLNLSRERIIFDTEIE